MTTKETASASNGNGSTPGAVAPMIDTDTVREIAAAEVADPPAGTDTGTAPMSAVPEPVGQPPMAYVPPPREPGLTAEPPLNEGDRDTISDEHVPGTTNPRTTRKIVLVALGLGILAALLVGARLFSGTAADTETTRTPAPVSAPLAGKPATAAAVVPKDTDATECASMGVSTDTFRDGWCTGRAPGAYLLADDTLAYCSCAKPRKAAAGK
jgi:hypothetical protein